VARILSCGAFAGTWKIDGDPGCSVATMRSWCNTPAIRSPARLNRGASDAFVDNHGSNAISQGLGSPHQGLNSFQCPSETTSTVPSITLTAVSSSIAYVGTGSRPAHFSAFATSW
jgi:hypothetical protein